MREWQLVCEEVTRFIAADEARAPAGRAAARGGRALAALRARLPAREHPVHIAVPALAGARADAAGKHTARHAAALHYSTARLTEWGPFCCMGCGFACFGGYLHNLL